ncbi:MAG: formylmethanofuran--tetrahydromethanopterin N-formyltransferase [archaeon]|nr:formylmethanofuran--tetrahydromethanopterin N-formyltransferase [archaeon]MCP8316825.1 formylmethanofuran--tetrahydromethanopterin N-formyltransferase [archaeon]MCP8319339.1 formylmethanofuran--tetrahydromethanopterin N-formyltransferase [archaeon]
MSEVEVEDTFAEAFPMLAGRMLVTAENEKWALTAGKTATGFASSIIMSPAEAGVEGIILPPEKTPDGRPGVMVQIYHRTLPMLKFQMLARIGQCILTCPTTAIFNGIPDAKKYTRLGKSIRMFADGYEKMDKAWGKKIWRIPVMEGEFIIEDRFGLKKAVAGGNLLIMADSQKAALKASEDAVEAMGKVEGVVLTFPGGICRSGSKVGSTKYKLPASTNHPFCPALKGVVPESKVPPNVNSIYELVFNGLTEDIVKRATAAGIKATMKVPGVVKISAVNFGGKLGPYQIKLKEALEKY